MTPNEIKAKVERYLNRDTIDIEHINDALEESINWLGRAGYIIDTLIFDAEEKEFYELPDDLISVIKVEDTDEEEYYEGYLIDGKLIRFEDAGKYRVFGERQPQVPDGPDKELALYPLLQYCVLDYVKGFCKVSIDDRSEDGHRLMQKFQQDSLKAYQAIKRGRNSPSNWKVIRRA